MTDNRFYASGRPTVAAAPNRDPRAFQSGIAQGVEEIGGALYGAARASNETDDRLAALEYQRRVSEEVTARTTQLADAREAFAKIRTEARLNPKTRYAEGHLDYLTEEYGKLVRPLMDGITTRDAEEAIARQIAAESGQWRPQEAAWQVGYRAEQQREDGKRGLEYHLSIAREAGFGGDEAAADAGALAYIDGVAKGFGSPDREGEWRRAATADVLVAKVSGGIGQRQFKEARATLGLDGVKRVLSADQIEGLTRELEVEERRAANEAERDAAKLVAAQKEEEATLLGEVGRGVAVPAARLTDAAKRAEARGDTSKAAELRAAAVAAGVNRAYGDGAATPGQMTARQAAIEGTQNWRANPALVAEHAQLGKLAGEARSAEPVLAPLDFNDPAAVRARAQAQGVYARTHNGRRLFLGQDQAAELAALAQSGPAGRLQVAEALSRVPGEWGIVALEQVAKGDAAMRAALDLPGPLRKQVFAGEQAAKDNPKYAPRAELADRWGETGNLALAKLPPEWAGSVKAATDAVYAARAAQRNLTEFDQGVYDQAQAEVLAANGRGQIGRWRGQSVLLPRGMTGSQMEDRLYAMPEQVGATWDGKQPLTKTELLSRFRPVPQARDGVYRWVDQNGGYAMRGPGQLFETDMRQLPRAGPVERRPQGPIYRAPPPAVKLPQGPVYRAPPGSK